MKVILQIHTEKIFLLVLMGVVRAQTQEIGPPLAPAEMLPAGHIVHLVGGLFFRSQL